VTSILERRAEKELSAAFKGVQEGENATLKVLLASTWRSGSTFAGQMVENAIPAAFYAFEPLLPQILTTEGLSADAKNVLAAILDCNFDHLDFAGNPEFHWSIRQSSRFFQVTSRDACNTLRGL